MDEEKFLIGIDLANASPLLIELLIEDSTEPALFREIAKANINRPDILVLIMENPDTPEEVKEEISAMLRVPVKPKKEVVHVQRTPETILQRIQKLSVSERILLALRGGKEVRTILLRDPNKEVALTVMENPKITETEVELIARSRSIAEEALRKITKKREWMKNYNVILALVTNPKTPIPISISLVGDLKTKDLAVLEKSRNVAEGVRLTAKKLVRARKGH